MEPFKSVIAKPFSFKEIEKEIQFWELIPNSQSHELQRKVDELEFMGNQSLEL